MLTTTMHTCMYTVLPSEILEQGHTHNLSNISPQCLHYLYSTAEKSNRTGSHPQSLQILATMLTLLILCCTPTGHTPNHKSFASTEHKLFSLKIGLFYRIALLPTLSRINCPLIYRVLCILPVIVDNDSPPQCQSRLQLVDSFYTNNR